MLKTQQEQIVLWELRKPRSRGFWLEIQEVFSHFIERKFQESNVPSTKFTIPSITQCCLGIQSVQQEVHLNKKGNHFVSNVCCSVCEPKLLIRRTTCQWSWEEMPTAGQDGKLVPGPWHPFPRDEMWFLEKSLRKGLATVKLPNTRHEFNLSRRIMTDTQTKLRCRMRRLCQTSNDARRPIQQPNFEDTIQPRRFHISAPTEGERETVACHFNGDPNMYGYELVDVRKIHNYTLYEAFNRQKNEMGKAHNQTMLFHGCPPGVIPFICQEGFDFRLYGKNAAVYGNGAYFAKYPSYSHKFSDVGRPKGTNVWRLLVAQVVVGRYAQGCKGMARPPRLHAGGKFYDTVVDSVSDPHVFVTFETCRAYPDFIMTYKKTTVPRIFMEPIDEKMPSFLSLPSSSIQASTTAVPSLCSGPASSASSRPCQSPEFDSSSVRVVSPPTIASSASCSSPSDLSTQSHPCKSVISQPTLNPDLSNAPNHSNTSRPTLKRNRRAPESHTSRKRTTRLPQSLATGCHQVVPSQLTQRCFTSAITSTTPSFTSSTTTNTSTSFTSSTYSSSASTFSTSTTLPVPSFPDTTSNTLAGAAPQADNHPLPPRPPPIASIGHLAPLTSLTSKSLSSPEVQVVNILSVDQCQGQAAKQTLPCSPSGLGAQLSHVRISSPTCPNDPTLPPTPPLKSKTYCFDFHIGRTTQDLTAVRMVK